MTASKGLLERWVAFCCDRAWLVIAVVGLFAATAAVFISTHFAMTSDTEGLLSSSLPYRQRAAAFDKLFDAHDDQIVVVVDGRTPELTEAAAESLAETLRSRTDLISSVERPEAGFFAREGLLYQPLPEVSGEMNRLVSAQAFLGPLAQDPSLRGLMTTLSTVLTGVSSGETTLTSLSGPVHSLRLALDSLRQDQPTFFSWGSMISGQAPAPRALRRLVLISPVLDFATLESGSRASDLVRRSARALHLDAEHGVRVRLTGSIPLQDEQFGSIAHGVVLIAAMAFAAILLMLWMAVRSPRLIAAILITMLIGLAAAMAGGLLIFHRFNVISVAFIPLFVGLGIDFGIQVAVRYRTEHRPGIDVRTALIAAGSGMGRSLLLAATAIAVGFLAFAPTAYLGVSQLGVIAGVGMLLAVALNLSFLPALIQVMGLRPSRPAGGEVSLARLDAFILSRRKWVLGLAIGAAAGCAALLPMLRFDFNPFHLENRTSEAVSTSLELMQDPDQSPNTLEVVAPSLSKADALASRLSRLPQVAQARTLSSFVPADQAAKLAAIADAANLLDLTLDPIAVEPPPTDAEVVASLETASAKLQAAAGGGRDPAAQDARRLADDLAWLARAAPEARHRAQSAIMPGLTVLLAQTRAALQAQPVNLQSLPPFLVRTWLAANGEARVSLIPRGDSNTNAVLEAFIRAVRAVVPDVTGEPIGIYEGGRAIAGAFLEAGLLSFAAITVLLFLVLRRVRYVAITMAPIVLTGLLTLGSCVLIGQSLNYANIIALPLLFGIGVAFHIYFVMAWKSGSAHLLQSSLTRAIFFSALATATGFGSLWASNHPGTASMGELLMISLLWTLVSALLFQPALMGPPPAASSRDTGRVSG